jgi:hypothetical protein
LAFVNIQLSKRLWNLHTNLPLEHVLPFLSHIDVHWWPCLDANQIWNLNFIFECDIVDFFIYSIINMDLNVSCYFASLEKMIIDYPIKYIIKKWPISYSYVKTKQRSYECNTCLNDESTKFDTNVSIIWTSIKWMCINKINFTHQHTHTHTHTCTQWHTRYLYNTHTPTHSKRDHINDSLEGYYIEKKFIGKLFTLEIIF